MAGRLACALAALFWSSVIVIHAQEEESPDFEKLLPSVFDFKVIEGEKPAAPSYEALIGLADVWQRFPELAPLDPAPQSVIVPGSLQKKADGIGPMMILSPPQFYNVSDGSQSFGLLGRSETALGVSVDGMHILVGWNDPTGFLAPYFDRGLSSYAYSLDGGATFSLGDPLPVFTVDSVEIVPRGDPSIAVTPGLPETVYFANLAATRGITQNLGIAIARGTFGPNGITWNASRLLPSQGGLLDKEAIAVDPRSGSQLVYCAATDFLGLVASASQIVLYRSSDAGDHWGDPAVVSRVGKLDQQGVAMAVGADGEVYVAWERGKNSPTAEIVFSTSVDQGASFSAPRTLARITPTSLHPPVGFNRASGNDFPRLAVDYSSAHRGRLYCVYQDAGTNPFIHTDGTIINTRTGARAATGGVADGDIYLASSDDHGTTWSVPVLVGSDGPGDRKNQFWPVVTVDTAGIVNVIYYEDRELQPQPFDTAATSISLGNKVRRISSYQSLVDVIWRQSRDGGQSFSVPIPLNETTSNWSISASNIVPNYGDYITSVAVGNSLYTAWAQAVSYDIDPGPSVNSRFVPGIAFTALGGLALPGIARRSQVSTFHLAQNTPNPFNPVTRISFDLPDRKDMTLKVYNAIGQEVVTLMNGTYEAGHYTVQFNGANLPSGFYLYRLEAEQYSGMKKMMLIK